ncbi:MAG TPA: hypothetical protein PLC54_04170, partial [Spirochaetales bacterium]|nr:hypothetical protein [Spirochaetales bacterium]
MRKFLAVTRHEFKKAAANKTFVIITILGPFLLLAVTVLPTLFSNDAASVSGGKPIGVIASTDALWEQLSTGLQAAGLESARVTDPVNGKAAVLEGSYAALVEQGALWPDEPCRFYSRSGTDMVVYSAIASVLDSYAMELRMGQL